MRQIGTQVAADTVDAHRLQRTAAVVEAVGVQHEAAAGGLHHAATVVERAVAQLQVQAARGHVAADVAQSGRGDAGIAGRGNGAALVVERAAGR